MQSEDKLPTELMDLANAFVRREKELKKLEEMARLAFSDPIEVLTNPWYSRYECSELVHAVYCAAYDNWRRTVVKESGMRAEFLSRLDEFIPGAKKINRKGKKGNIPDAFIEIDGEVCPMEMKASPFNDKALEQLERYMRVFDCKIGLAVAPSYDTAKRSNVRFIRFEAGETRNGSRH